MLKKLTTLIIISCMMITSTATLSFANKVNDASLNNKDISVMQISDNQLLVNEAGVKSTIVYNETDTGARISVNNLSTGESDYFIRDEVKGTLYSSITGNTVPLEENYNLERSSSTIKYSYKTLLTVVAVGASAATILSGIVGLIGYVAGASILTIINGILGLINAGLSSASSTRGLKVTISPVRMTKWQGGKEIVYYVDKITDVSTY